MQDQQRAITQAHDHLSPQPEPVPLLLDQQIFYQLFEFAPDGIVVIGGRGFIKQINGQAEKMFGFSREELVGQPIEVLIPERFAQQHVGHRGHYLAEPRTRPMGATLELFARRKDSSEFPVDIMLSPVEMEQNTFVLTVVRDVTERKAAEVKAREALRREMLLEEIHHRVKNNLQVISSLLFLQSLNMTDQNTLEILKDSQSRVKSIALVHEKLYRSEDLERLNFDEYACDLVADLLRTYEVYQHDVVVHTDIKDISLGIDTATPCGLIINELVSNALKHAFPGGRKWELWIEFHPLRGMYALTVRNNGVGLPQGFDLEKSKSLGLKLVRDLTKQLEGQVEVDTGKGTAFHITFKELQYKERW